MTAGNRNGLFDRSQAGRKLGPASFEVERDRIAAYCTAIGETDPVYFERKAAIAEGFHDVIAPPIFVQVIEQETRNRSAELGEPTVIGVIGGDYRYLVLGSEDVRFHEVICAGDILNVSHEILAFDDRKNGALERAHVRTLLSGPGGRAVAEIVRTYIHRLPEPVT